MAMFERWTAKEIANRLSEPRQFIQIVTGPRQTGKTTALRQAIDHIDLPTHVVSADGLSRRPSSWLEIQWDQARRLTQGGVNDAVLVVDEVQRIDQWSNVVKMLWDEDTWNNVPLKVVLSGSSSLLLQRGMDESLMGRFEVIHSTHWSFNEMHDAFGYDLDDFLLYGGYPGAAARKGDENRWLDYMLNSIITPAIDIDTIELEDVRKPALMKRLFELGTQYSAQEISFRKILGQLDDAGNTTTIAGYLDLLSKAGLLCGLQKFDVNNIRSRKSSPRLMAYDTSLITASAQSEAQSWMREPKRGHLVESAVGAYLLARSVRERFEVYWWRDGTDEVDFVLRKGERVTAIEVKSSRIDNLDGMAAFLKRFPSAMPIVVGDRNTSVEDFLSGKVPLFV